MCRSSVTQLPKVTWPLGIQEMRVLKQFQRLQRPPKAWLVRATLCFCWLKRVLQRSWSFELDETSCVDLTLALDSVVLRDSSSYTETWWWWIKRSRSGRLDRINSTPFQGGATDRP